MTMTNTLIQTNQDLLPRPSRMAGSRTIVPPIVGARPDLNGSQRVTCSFYPLGVTREQNGYSLTGGGFVLETLSEYGWSAWRYWPSLLAYEDYVRSLAIQDIEGRVGEFFPSDYRRLKIKRVMSQGSRFCMNAVDCESCQATVPHVESVYRVTGGENGQPREYHPFCRDCAGA